MRQPGLGFPKRKDFAENGAELYAKAWTSEAVKLQTRRLGDEELAQGGEHRGWKRLAMVAAGAGRTPKLGTARANCSEIGTVEFVEAGAAQTEFGARIGAREFLGAEAAEHIADEKSGMTGVELTGVFIQGT